MGNLCPVLSRAFQAQRLEKNVGKMLDEVNGASSKTQQQYKTARTAVAREKAIVKEIFRRAIAERRQPTDEELQIVRMAKQRQKLAEQQCVQYRKILHTYGVSTARVKQLESGAQLHLTRAELSRLSKKIKIKRGDVEKSADAAEEMNDMFADIADTVEESFEDEYGDDINTEILDEFRNMRTAMQNSVDEDAEVPEHVLDVKEDANMSLLPMRHRGGDDDDDYDDGNSDSTAFSMSYGLVTQKQENRQFTKQQRRVVAALGNISARGTTRTSGFMTNRSVADFIEDGDDTDSLFEDEYA